MGCSFHVYGGLGVVFDRDDLFQVTQKRSCEHKQPMFTAPKFCSQCGKEVKREVEEFLLADEIKDPEELDFSAGEPIGKERLVILSIGHEGDEKLVILDHFMQTDPEYGNGCGMLKLTPAILKASREKCERLLHPYDLWDENEFGFQLIGQISC